MNKIALAVVLAASLAACEKEPANPVKEYGTALTDSYRKAEETADLSIIKALTHAAEIYRSQNEKFPETLEELAAFAHIEADPGKFNYDPQTGRITKK